MHDTHDVRLSQKLAIAEVDARIYRGFVHEIEKRIKMLEQAFAIHRETIGHQVEINKHVLERLHALEEKERERAREKHQIELTLDEISEPVPYVPPPEREWANDREI